MSDFAKAPGRFKQIKAGKVESRDHVWLGRKWRKVKAAVTHPTKPRIKITTGLVLKRTWRLHTDTLVDVARQKDVWR